jgi:hypothetical protein
MLHTQVHRCHSQMQAHLTFIRWTHLIFYHLLWIIRLGVGRSSRCTGPNLVEDVAVDRTTARVWVSILVLATVFCTVARSQHRNRLWAIWSGRSGHRSPPRGRRISAQPGRPVWPSSLHHRGHYRWRW